MLRHRQLILFVGPSLSLPIGLPVPFCRTVQNKDVSPSERELEKALERVEILNRKIHNLNEQVRYYRHHLALYQTAEHEADVRLFRLQYQDIGNLLYIWNIAEQEKLTDHERVVRTGRILKKVSGGQDGLGTLVNDINLHFNNVLVHLADDFPNMGPADFKLYCYLVVGFDNNLIVELLGLPEKSTLYTRKCRLLERLEGSSSPNKAYYLTLAK